MLTTVASKDLNSVAKPGLNFPRSAGLATVAETRLTRLREYERGFVPTVEWVLGDQQLCLLLFPALFYCRIRIALPSWRQ